jgi:hypothetical protein
VAELLMVVPAAVPAAAAFCAKPNNRPAARAAASFEFAGLLRVVRFISFSLKQLMNQAFVLKIFQGGPGPNGGPRPGLGTLSHGGFVMTAGSTQRQK